MFEIIAEPNRRAILSLLALSQQSVGEIARQLRMSQPTVSKHLRVLREAGFVEATVDAQRRLYRLKPGPLQEVDAWLAPFRRFWSAHVDALERHLDRWINQRQRKGRQAQRGSAACGNRSGEAEHLSGVGLKLSAHSLRKIEAALASIRGNKNPETGATAPVSGSDGLGIV